MSNYWEKEPLDSHRDCIGRPQQKRRSFFQYVAFEAEAQHAEKSARTVGRSLRSLIIGGYGVFSSKYILLMSLYFCQKLKF